jgi:hypothetical protein
MFDIWVPENPIDGTYAFLPIEFFENGMMRIRWKNELTAEDIEK